MSKRIPPPKDKFKRKLVSDLEHEMSMNGITYKDLEELFGISAPTINKSRKDPGNFTVNQLLAIAKVCKSTLSINFNQ